MTNPVSSSPVNPMQKALLVRLAGDSTLMGLLGGAGRIVDQIPEGSLYPHIRLGESLSIPDNAHGQYGREVTQTLHVWTKTRTNAQGQDIAARANELLDHQPAALIIEGHKTVSIRCEFDQALTDPDPQIRHHVLRYRVVTEQEE